MIYTVNIQVEVVAATAQDARKIAWILIGKRGEFDSNEFDRLFFVTVKDNV